MKSDEIKALFAQFEQASAEFEGVECWSARELQSLLGYSKWENFSKVIDKAKESCQNAGEKIAYHFPDVRKTIPMPKGAEKEIDDILLTRYACYLIAQNGDSRKEQIAFAQNYFAVQTRRAEIIEQRILDYERVKARAKLAETEKNLSGILFERGVDDKGFAIIIKAKDLAAEMTSVNVQAKDLYGVKPIETEHVDNNLAVRNMLLERGIVPEELPPAEDIKKVERKLKSDEKKALKSL